VYSLTLRLSELWERERRREGRRDERGREGRRERRKEGGRKEGEKEGEDEYTTSVSKLKLFQAMCFGMYRSCHKQIPTI